MRASRGWHRPRTKDIRVRRHSPVEDDHTRPISARSRITISTITSTVTSVLMAQG